MKTILSFLLFLYVIPSWKIFELLRSNIPYPAVKYFSGNSYVCDEKGCLTSTNCTVSRTKDTVKINCGENYFPRFYSFVTSGFYSSGLTSPSSPANCIKLFAFTFYTLFSNQKEVYPGKIPEVLSIDVNKRRVVRAGDEIAYSIGDKYSMLWFHSKHYVPLRVYVKNKKDDYFCDIRMADFRRIGRRGYFPYYIELSGTDGKILKIDVKNVGFINP